MTRKQENRTSHDDYADAKAWLKSRIAAGYPFAELSDADLAVVVSNAILRKKALSLSTIRQLREVLNIKRVVPVAVDGAPPTRAEFDALDARVAQLEGMFKVADTRMPAVEIRPLSVPTGPGPHPVAGTSGAQQ